MFFTPAAGVPMSTRPGDLDPGLVRYLERTEKISAQQFNEMINSQSGLLEIQKPIFDMRDLLDCDLLDCEKQDGRAAAMKTDFEVREFAIDTGSNEGASEGQQKNFSRAIIFLS